ncbi:ATP binding protein [Tulasnella sp. 403]|nr:ATP binding protein [Tulasnella sp. 403]
MRYAIFVCGPAGAGKTTLCTSLITHLRASKRSGNLFNLDPAANQESFEYRPSIDIRELITLDDAMTHLHFGPNGALMYCFEYLMDHLDWLDEEVGDYDSDFLIIDCPGQIELYTHHAILPTLMQHFQQKGIRTCGVYLLESQFMEDRYKYFAGVLSAMSAMVNLAVPWINIMSKMDLITPSTTKGRNGMRSRKDITRYLEADTYLLSDDTPESRSNPKFHALNEALARLIEDHPLVSFLPLDLTDTDSLETILSHIDYTLQYGEDEEPKEPQDMDEGDFPDETG